MATFQEPSGPPVFCISLKAGGVGLNLTAADYVFIMAPWWNPAVENQAVDRTHRIGQHTANGQPTGSQSVCGTPANVAVVLIGKY